MAFFQNKNTVSPPDFEGSSPNGDDYTELNTWFDFLSNPKHSKRKEAFQEFIFLMYFGNDRQINGREFPHDNLCHLVLKFFVNMNPVTGIPMNDSGIEIFTRVALGSELIYTPDATVGNKLPGLRPAGDAELIKSEIKAAIVAGETSLGSFHETMILFAYFYLIKRMALLNDYIWDFDANLIGDKFSFIKAKYPINFVTRMNNMLDPTNVNSFNKNPDDLPYFFNSLLSALTTQNFNTSALPLPSDTSDVTKNAQLNMTFFTMLFDPVKNMINSTDAIAYSSATIAICMKNKIDIDLGAPVAWDFNDNFNRFIFDLAKVMRNGVQNPLYKTIARSPATAPIISSFPVPSPKESPIPVVKQYNKHPGTDLIKEAQLKADIHEVYDQIQAEIQAAIDFESELMKGILLSDITTPSSSTIFAAGQGAKTSSLFGVECLGVPFFKYNLNSDCLPLTENQVSGFSVINNVKKNIVHLLATGIDGEIPSNIEIEKDGLTFKFDVFPHTTMSALVNNSIEASPIPSSSANFFLLNDSVSESTSYYKKIIIDGVEQNVKVAEYFKQKRDLVFSQFTEEEISNYSFPPLSTLNAKIKSGGTDENIEEFQVLLTVFEDEFPRPKLFNADVTYENNTFQLGDNTTFESPNASSSNVPSINKNSYKNLFSKSSDKNTIQFIFDLLKQDFIKSSPTTTLKPPVLTGGFVGKLISGISPRVGPDTSYKQKYTGSGTIDEPSSIPADKKKMYKMLRYSYAIINIDTTLTSIPGIVSDRAYSISLEINSFVSPDKSNLDTHYSGDKLTFFNSKKGSGSNNQVLAMLRTFGLLEGIVRKMIFLLENDFSTRYTADEKTYIKHQLDTWFNVNGVGSVGDPSTIVCNDFVGELSPTNLAVDINRNEYEYLKRW